MYVFILNLQDPLWPGQVVWLADDAEPEDELVQKIQEKYSQRAPDPESIPVANQ
jgi:hypothetical protein